MIVKELPPIASYDPASRVAVSDAFAFEFHPQAYAPSQDYDGRFGHFDFRKHYYGRMGDFDSKDEFDCACWLSEGRCRFVMIKDRQWEQIEPLLT